MTGALPQTAALSVWNRPLQPAQTHVFSDPPAEEAETELKASALIDAIVRGDQGPGETATATTAHEGARASTSGEPRKVLLVDHEDSFVHTLANYLRQTGAEVVTCRSGPQLKEFMAQKVDGAAASFRPDLVVLSPGPGSPSDFHLSETIQTMIDRKIPIFGVCLGLQGLVEYFGGELGVLGYPMHGKPSIITRSFDDGKVPASAAAKYDGPATFDVLRGLPKEFQVARYHSLHGKKATLPKELVVTALSADDIVMAVQHEHMPIAAVQWHPEGLLTDSTIGLALLRNALNFLKKEHYV